MPPRERRPENRGLPKRWRRYHGAYYYLVPQGMEDHWDGKRQFRLGTTLAEAHRTWAQRLELHGEAKLIRELLDRYAFEVVPDKAPKTQASNRDAIRHLRAVFGHMPISALKPVHVYGYRDRRGKKARTAANREIEVLSHAFTKAIEWGLREDHPIKLKVIKLSTPGRDRYIEDWELIEALRVASPLLRAYIGLKLLTALRRGDLLRLRLSDVRREEGIHVQPHKTAKTTRKRITIRWSEALHEAVDECLAVRRKVGSIFLFATTSGQPYVHDDGTANAFDSLWQRFMKRVLAKTKVRERFTEHDLRAKCASDAESLEHARQLLAHADSKTTQKFYRRKGEVVRPLK